ncbi:MAG: glycosyltransferase [Gemmataceae bacterium]
MLPQRSRQGRLTALGALVAPPRALLDDRAGDRSALRSGNQRLSVRPGAAARVKRPVGLVELAAEVEAFLAAGAAPIVFTPGSAMKHGHQFFAESVSACRLLGRRGLLLTRFPEQVPDNLPDEIGHFDYLPLSQVLPRSAALVSHGGIGTVSQALAAGIPQLVMPMAFDQFPNAARLVRLGVTRSLPAKAYRSPAVALALADLLKSREIFNRCQAIARRFHPGQPLEKACQAIEEFAEQPPRRTGVSPVRGARRDAYRTVHPLSLDDPSTDRRVARTVPDRSGDC